MVPHQLVFAANQHTQPQSQITETLRSRRFSLQSPFGEKSEMVRQCRSESSVPFVSALFSLRFWLGPPVDAQPPDGAAHSWRRPAF